MKLRKPNYYDKFKCTMNRCKNNCCKGKWDIEIDEGTLEFYKDSLYSDKLMQSVEEKDGYTCFKRKNSACVWLDKNGLCRIYSEYGPEYQSVVCDMFPRFAEYFGDIKEIGIGMACEEAVNICLTEKGFFSVVENDIKESPYDDPNFNSEFADFVFTLRSCLFDLINKSSEPTAVKIINILNTCSEVQNYINDDKLLDEHEIMQLVEEKHYPSSKHYDFPKNAYDMISTFLEYLSDFPDMEDEYTSCIDKIDRLINNEYKGNKLQTAISSSYNVCLKSGRYKDYDHMLNYWMFRYFSRSVYDGDVLSKAKLLAVLFITMRLSDLIFTRQSKEKLSLNKRIEQIVMLSRQIEYSEDNIEQLYEYMLFDEAFSDIELKRLLTMFIN